MSRLKTVLLMSIAIFALALVEPCSAQSSQLGNVAKATNENHNRTGHPYNNHWHSNAYREAAVGYYPYAIPYSYGYGRYGGYFPYGRVYSNYGYPVNLNSGLERGFQYGNTYINPNFGN